MTPLDTPDELALPAFEDALWAALRAERACSGAEAGTPFPSASTADDVGGDMSAVGPVGPFEEEVRRRRVPRRVLVAAAIALLVGLGIVTAAGDGDPVTTAGPSAEVVEGVDLPIEERAAAAMYARIGTTVVQESTGGSPVRVVRYVDGRTGAERRVWAGSAGRILAEQGSTRVPVAGADPTMTTVDHCADAVYATGSVSWIQTPLEELALGLDDGVWAADGTEVVDGRRLIRLRSWPLGIPGGVDDAGRGERPTPEQWDPTMALYLDPETLLPVLERHRIGQDDEVRTTYALLPRSRANRDQTLVTVPDSYEERPESEWVEPSTDAPAC